MQVTEPEVLKVLTSKCQKFYRPLFDSFDFFEWGTTFKHLGPDWIVTRGVELPAVAFPCAFGSAAATRISPIFILYVPRTGTWLLEVMNVSIAF